MSSGKIVVLGGKGASTNMVFNAIHARYGDVVAIIEAKESVSFFVKRRIKKLGFGIVVGQLLFQIVIVNLLIFFSKKRIDELIRNNNLNTTPIPSDKKYEVSSVNAEETLLLLKKIKPSLIIVNGTRIISKNVIANAGCKLINTHAGITPKYRGVHGAYWALANNDYGNCGVTVHFVDSGIDTGSVISQALIKPTSKDNFVTYPLIQLSAGIELLMKAIDACLRNSVTTSLVSKESSLWYHPTIWFYLWNRLFRNVK